MGAMAEDRRFSIWTILAPLGLIGVLIVALMLVRDALEPQSPAAAEPTVTATATTPTLDASVPAFYSIRRGDTLSAIAERYGVTTDYIVQLNPNLNPMALAVHAKIRLR